MKLSEKLNVLIQAITLSQKSGVLDLNDAVKAKYAIDVICSGVINKNFTSAIDTIIEIIVSSQKKGAYSLKDAYMIYLAIDGIEGELKNEFNRINNKEISLKEEQKTQTQNYKTQQKINNNKNIVIIPPQELKTKRDH